MTGTAEAMILLGIAGLLVLAAVAWANFVKENWVVDALIALAIAMIAASLFWLPKPGYMDEADPRTDIPREMRD